ncbi:MAG: DUF2188 domain-containing protein [Ignavibacteriaceae bacterium]
MNKKDIIITPFFGNWAIMIEGKSEPISTHNLKSDAIRVANQAAKRLKSGILITENDEKVKKINQAN